ncbi:MULTISPECIES: NAD(P)/FAD-dependent oxidoreductase [unclassified Bradyrhizobium]|uniref:flavin-containing monooxygenase n=1 Tax=unclassified Bradyrhizobium TaxID=2631580 RepID=UPI001FF8CA61|nr:MULTISPECIES: NAD(P)/FAD-dependent oxidoreductase [unclassified Bradyrhizobium]MCK1715945.1 NAD(P)/FAD-dependent oxidoreductase [Bradyrhizobium sp. 143]MCK1725743.1 NAD(P)/FAD-dependent oxidoreductase [Bradyrhizobium sp. 142]
MESNRHLRIAVIGAGASGIAAAIRLREIGTDHVVVFEKAAEVGGTWRDNNYPGLTCDVPSHLYRYSFAPNPDWSHKYAPGSEIQAYVSGIADRFGVRSLIRFNHEMTEASWTGSGWRLQTNQGDQGEFDAVISAVGVLHHPSYPRIARLADFEGVSFHSARWDHSVALEGKRVGIIGTGSTAVQILPAIVDGVAKVSLFQRTAQWIFPEINSPTSEERKQAFRTDPSLMAQEYLRLAKLFNGAFCAALAGENPEVYEEMRLACLNNLNTVAAPDLRSRLTPNYRVGCKRLIVSGLFYPAIQRPNAELVDDPILHAEPRGLVSQGGRLHELDVLVLATGFETHRPFGRAIVRGAGGHTLEEAWADGNITYRAVTTPGFPNWFMIGGPYSPIGNFSFLMTAERQISYVLQLVELLSSQARAVAPRRDATLAYFNALKERAKTSIWASGCRSWYIDAHGNIASYPWGYDVFERDMSKPVLSDYEVA